MSWDAERQSRAPQESLGLMILPRNAAPTQQHDLIRQDSGVPTPTGHHPAEKLRTIIDGRKRGTPHFGSYPITRSQLPKSLRRFHDGSPLSEDIELDTEINFLS